MDCAIVFECAVPRFRPAFSSRGFLSFSQEQIEELNANAAYEAAGPSTAMTVKTLADTFGNTTAGLVDKLLGPAATNIGIQFGRLFEIRNERSEELLKAAQRKIEDLEIDVQRISARLYVALLNEASLEEDSDIQKIWADVLINAADKRQVNLVKDSFARSLSENLRFGDRSSSRFVARVGGGSGFPGEAFAV